MKKVEAVYVDARDGRPATETPLRHGPAMPHEQLEVDAIDRTQRPSRIYGRLPDGEPLSAGMREISDDEHQAAVDLVQERRTSAHLQRLARIRYERETGGVKIDGRALHTDRDSQGKLAGSRAKAKEGRAPSAWKLDGGDWWDVEGAEEFVAVADEVFEYIDACFKHERDLSAKILNGERPDIEEGWPSAERSTS